MAEFLSASSATGSILYVITTISRGGAENHLLELVRSQVAAGCRIAVAYLKGDGYWRTSLESSGVRVVDLHMSSYGEIGPIVRLRALISEFSPAIVHAHMPPAELYSRLALQGISRQELPLVITKHNDERFYNGIGQRQVGRWVVQRAEKVIAISESVMCFMSGSQGLRIPPEKMVTIHYGIDIEPYEIIKPEETGALRQSWGVAADDFLIGTVARLVPQKALHILLQGFALYQAQARRSTRLVLVGAGPLEAELKQLAERLGIQNSLIWAGFREDIPVVMNALDVFALTSLYEGFGLVLLEAMAAGRAVVASRISAIPEIVLNGETGLLVRAADPGSLPVAFTALEDDTFRLKLGRAGRERARSRFTIARMASETARLYAACLRETRHD